MRPYLLIWAIAWTLCQGNPESEVGLVWEVPTDPIVEVVQEKMGQIIVRTVFSMKRVKESTKILKSIVTTYEASPLLADPAYKTKHEDKLDNAEKDLDEILKTLMN